MARTGESLEVPKSRSAPRRRASFSSVLDYLFFVFGGVAAIWLAWLVLTESFEWGWFLIAFFLIFWIVLAYLVLPRLHRILTEIYVPDYFIGRARTSDGLLGDPINLALLGSEAQLDDAMREAGWTRADDVTFRSSRRIIVSVRPAMKSQKSSTICRCSSALTRPTHGALHLPM